MPRAAAPVAAVLVGLGLMGGCTFVRSGVLSDARDAVAEGDRGRLRELVEANPSLRSGGPAAVLVGTSGCRPDMIKFMLAELHVDPTGVDDWGDGAVNLLLTPGSERLEHFDAEGYRQPCEDSRATYKSLQMLVAVGASVCDATLNLEQITPRNAVRYWDWPDDIVRAVEAAADAEAAADPATC